MVPGDDKTLADVADLAWKGWATADNVDRDDLEVVDGVSGSSVGGEEGNGIPLARVGVDGRRSVSRVAIDTRSPTEL